MNHFSKLAHQILTSNDQHAYAQMSQAICDPSNLQGFLNQIPHSNELHFIFTQLLMKSILNGDFCPINQTKSDDNNMRENVSERTKFYETIIPRVFQNICSGSLQKEYIIKSALNLISVCMKDLCDHNKNLPLFVSLLQGCLFPAWKVNEYFTSSLNGDLVFIQPSTSVINYFMSNNRALQVYKHSAKILIQLIEYVTMVTVYKTYYEYRRNIYTFRNIYLPTILNVATEYHKILYLEWKKNPTESQIIDALTISIGLVEKIIAYPFSLTLHEFESQDQNNSVVGINAEIYFPSTYRNVLCDRVFLDMLFEFFFFLIKELSSVNQLGDTVYSMIKILGRIISASVYTFNAQDERKNFRSYCAQMVISLLFNFKFFDSFYIYSLCDIFCKVLSSYTTVDLQQNRQKLYQGIMFYCQALIQNCAIKLQDGKRNPFNRAFELIVNCLTQTKQTMYYDYITLKSQQILNKAFAKLYSWQYTQKIMNEFGKNQKTQIQCFQQLFEHVHVVFAVNLQGNLNNLKQLNVETLAQSQQTVWLHLCAVLLPNHLATRAQTQLILKYFKVAQQGNTMASLHYIYVLINQVLYDMENGSPSTSLWNHIRDIQGCAFTDFVLYVLGICKKNFEQTNTDIIDYALEVFKSIYMKLKKHSATENHSVQEKFDPFYNEVKQLIGNLSNTVFESPKFFKRRVQLFSVISTIWINSQNYKYLPQIYNLVSEGVKQDLRNYQLQNISLDPTRFLKYMHDMRGILEPIQDSDCFKIICQLAIQDFQVILPIIFNTQQVINTLFGQQVFLKAFCKMILQFVTDFGRRITHHVQTEIPFQIHDLFRPYLIEVAKHDYPKCTVKIWEKFSSLHPLQDMLPLVPSFKQKDQKEFTSLIKQYFDNIHRVELSQLESLYPYIEDKVEYLSQWWEEVVRRKLHPNVSLSEVVESRIAATKRQKEELAKLIFFVGSYDQKYWNLAGWTDERAYVKWFLENYKEFRE